jgi:hypothetical protein
MAVMAHCNYGYIPQDDRNIIQKPYPLAVARTGTIAQSSQPDDTGILSRQALVCLILGD